MFLWRMSGYFHVYSIHVFVFLFYVLRCLHVLDNLAFVFINIIGRSLYACSCKICCEKMNYKLLTYHFRWHNHLDPAIKKDAWTEEEDSALAYYHQIYGSKWAEIARYLPGRYTYLILLCRLFDLHSDITCFKSCINM